ncbi:MAG: ABC transporter permease [Bacteroidota bacterium]
MLRHNLLLAFRSFLKNKNTFLINLLGLSTGLTCVLLIYLWVNDEWSVDKFHQNDAHLYQVMINAELPNGNQIWKGTPGVLAETLVEELPEVEAATLQHYSIFKPKGMLIKADTKLDVEGLFAGENYFELFSYPLIEGNVETLLKDKNSIVLSESSALKLFGKTTGLIGEALVWSNDYFDAQFQISGIYQDVPQNASHQFDAVVHYDWLIDWDRYANEWSGGYAETIVLLKDNTDLALLSEKMTQLYKEKRQFNKPRTLFVQKYSEQYLYGNYENGVVTGGRIIYVRLFSIIALLILLIAAINFMNLSTAQASKKLKLIGVKKVVGASRTTLMGQFFSEAILLSLLSTLLALFIVYLCLPAFNDLTGKVLQISLQPTLLFSILGISLLTGILAGSYPAFYLSGFKPITVLKGKLDAKMGEQWIRKGLVVFQFVLSVIFIVSMLIIQQQMNFIQNKHLGYERDNVLTFQRPAHEGDPQVFLAELKKIAGVEDVGNMYSNITNRFDNQSGYSWRGEAADKKILFEAPRIGYNVIETLGMEVSSGRSFSNQMKDDDSKIVINESAAKLMQLEDPIGKMVEHGSGQYEQIIGVVKDFQYGSIHKKIEPLIFRFRSGGRDILLRLTNGQERNTIAQVEQIFKQFHPDHTFAYSFLDSKYQALYEAEDKVATLSKYFSGLAILISCLGLLGLVLFTAERRQKEIGIRKVLGASIANIVGLLSKDFLKLVMIAFIIAVPIAYYAVQYWLSNFAYHVEIKWWIFVLAGLATIGVALFTVSFQSVRAALANPIESLRSE